MRISRFQRIDTLSYPGLYMSSVALADDDGEGVNRIEVANTLLGDRDSIDAVKFYGDGCDILDISGVHGLIREVRPGHKRCMVETAGERPEILDDLIGAGYAEMVSFVFCGDLDRHQRESVAIARDGDCTFYVTVMMDPDRVGPDSLLDIGETVKGAETIVLRTVDGPRKYKKSEMASLAKSLKGTARKVLVC